MAIGRISGPLLAQNLLRNGVDLAFETDLLYLDVTNGRIGVRTNTPQAELEVNGDIIAHKINVNTATIGLTTIESSETSSTISTSLGPLNIQAGGQDIINLLSDVELYGSLHATGTIIADGNIFLGNSTASDTLYIGADIESDLVPSLTAGTGTQASTSTIISPFSVGTTSSFWANGYFDKVNTNFIDSGTGTDVTVFPNPLQNLDGSAGNLFNINGDIRVYGGNPIGTAPVVSNVLYVTMDGDDANDGRAEDSSRACRTITGAVQSPFYKEGTIIKVRSGRYLENNPIELKPYTAIVGDDLRTTFIEPINKDVDLFWVNSGVYIAQMAFLNLRKGEVTRYAPGGTGEYKTGAYCVAFPPLLENPIDVYHSPYVQNCTNQSGPWLYDQTMFVPNHTVQVPKVWGTGTWAANTTSVIFHKSPEAVETIELGYAIEGSGILVDPAVPHAVITHISNPDTTYLRAQTLLENNRAFIQEEVIGYLSINYSTVVFDAITCKRDVGLIVDAITYDAILGGNTKSVIAGLSYYNGNQLVIGSHETTATIAAFQYIDILAQKVLLNSPPLVSYQNNVYQYINTNLYGAEVVGPAVTARINEIVDILQTWPGIENASALISANRSFVQTEVVNWVDQTYGGSFQYDRGLCYRDVGLILDAVQYDLLHKSNVQSIIAAESYWEGATSIVSGEQPQTSAAIQYARDLTLNIVSNITATTVQSTVTQVVNTGLNGGVLALPSITANFDMIASVVTSGTNYLPQSTNSTLTSYLLTLSTVTSGVSSTASVYIGETTVYPVLEKDIPNRWDGGTWSYADRRVDPHGSGGGALVDGNAPSTRSPIQSFVFDAFTQLTQGGHGVHIINNGYAQLVSVFTIFNDIAVHCESGGIASITNSNSNFGDLCLVAEGFGKKEFNGTIYNAPFKSYDPNSNTISDDENYPIGYFPKYQEVAVFIPDAKNRPHISLVMEVVPPDYIIDYENQTVPYRNEQGFEGFLAAISNTGTLVAGSFTIDGIDTTGIAVGHTLTVRNQYGETGKNSTEYVQTGTVVTKVGYKSVTLNKAINASDGELYNENFFNLYFSGNAYYTILSSIVGPNVIPPGQNKIRGQEVETVAAINYLKTLAATVVANIATTVTYQTSISQVIDPGLQQGASAVSFINSELDAVIGIITQGPSATPVVKTTGTFIAGSTSAIELLKLNRKFLASEVLAFTTSTYQGFEFNNLKCYRDVQLMVDAVCEDLLTGGNFKACEAGNTYYSKDGTYHIVTIEEGVTNPLLFPDGCKVNFYQRSYMSASGYLFEYVGAGTDYGALPQVGRVDPVQSKEVVQVNNGKVFFTSTDQNGDYRIGPGLVISQATGVLSGRTFQKSLFAEMTPFILAVETGGEG